MHFTSPPSVWWHGAQTTGVDKEPINKGYPQSQPQAMVYLGILGSCLVCTEDVEMVLRVMMRQFDGTFGDPDLVQQFADLEKKPW